MARRAGVTIRPFNASRADAAGVLSVERATFNESPYTVEQVQSALTDGPQRAWLAVEGEKVVGFATAFLVTGLRGSWWEIDLLAVLPEWRGMRLGSRLVYAASAHGSGLAHWARATVAGDNEASMQAFLRVGFRPMTGMCNLLIYRPQDIAPPPRSMADVMVREVTDPVEVTDRFRNPSDPHVEAFDSPAPGEPLPRSGQKGGPGLTLLLAERQGQPAGYAELIEVQTLLYRGIWIESLLAPDRIAREALVEQAMCRIQAAGLDEIGAMLPERQVPLQRTLLNRGFRSLGRFRWLTAQLPLPNVPSFASPVH